MNLQTFFHQSSTKKIAQMLLGKLITYKDQYAGLIVETEAYLGAVDAGSHAYRGIHTKRNQALFCDGGSIYMYTMRGQFLLNFVTKDPEVPECVLLRGIEPTMGLQAMLNNRHGRGGIELTNGPAKLCQALDLHTLSYNGKYLGEVPLNLDLTHIKKPKTIISSPRIGLLDKGKWTNMPLRFYVQGNPYVSKMKKRDFDLDKRGWHSEKNDNG